MLLEQTYICSNEYDVIHETCELNLSPGLYFVKVEPLTNAVINVSNIRINDIEVGSSFNVD